MWKDPVCGDGLCEAPFEFAAYGRFGCRADCGNLIDLQALGALDVDLYYDFGHQAGSLPAAVRCTGVLGVGRRQELACVCGWGGADDAPAMQVGSPARSLHARRLRSRRRS